MARNAECRCESSFTCGYCLRNMKPWIFTPRSSAEAMRDSIYEKAPMKPDKMIRRLVALATWDASGAYCDTAFNRAHRLINRPQ